MKKLKAKSSRSLPRLMKRLLDEIPTNWCDPLLTGPDAALSEDAGKWGCPDIERLLTRLKERIRLAANVKGER